MRGAAEPELVLARRVLLDALDALEEHRSAFVLVGAQAIYLHVGEAGIAVAPLTLDADIAIEPDLLAQDPLIGAALRHADFSEGRQPGMWVSPVGPRVDLMVPEALGGRPGHRGADLGAHGKSVARKARGLECALVDNTLKTITALDERDDRSVNLRVAGPSALLVAKLHKLSDRRGHEDRLAPKDALDVLRLLQGTTTPHLASGVAALERDHASIEVTREGIGFLRDLFGAPGASGSRLAARAAAGLEEEATIVQSCASLTNDLLDALSS